MLEVNHISFQYPNQEQTLENINFTLNKGEHLCIMGESGSGKSTLLKIIYGLLDVNHGTLYWNEKQILGPAHHLVPGMDFFKYVAQDFDLMPYTSVSENIAKFLSRFYPEETLKRTKELLEVIEMSEFAHVKVKNLSGGQQQRVAIARALAKEPELLLLDEPFSQIDNFKKNSLRRKLFKYLKEKDIACIVATHDGNDALSFADKMMVIRNHIIIANDTPANLYKSVKEKYVAALFDDINEVSIEGKVQLLYPHQFQVSKEGSLNVSVVTSYFKGSHWLIESLYNNQPLFFTNPSSIDEKKTVLLRVQNCL
ncbi:ABC-type Fe3+/spermidine/putrescine transport systems, ATPase components [Tenacibaculum sp. MAR_2009_124]|uniref:ABC transporter ATP-binding protein n=1 Tax=Tenacibaculum sp. MAR_2009_124 TaxID=1250059 RepID=UPI000894C6ED|nr:ABC transporter ATP-binding protein [Tenacibaculum sp. MAR_2009_124]SEC39250.1 ABC-type Fe3+/spermidine/putrescine transport systems, ATPase components [Tenacibaculum sp. MAR_2009_124]